MMIRQISILLILTAIQMYGFATLIHGRQAGLSPGNQDGFETADWQNFRPNYVGSSTEFIRPRFDVTDENPVSGRYSLRWTAGGEEHEWLMLSNAFYLAQPFTASILFRTEDESGSWKAGFYMMQDYDFFSGIQINSTGAAIQIDADEWEMPVKEVSSIAGGEVYKLEISLDERNRFTASITNHHSGERIVEQSGVSAIQPGALAIYLKTDTNSNAILYFDDISVQSSGYYVESGKWTRSPQPYYVVLPRLPDVTQQEGNWVGGHSVMKTEENEYLMWYRIRDNIQRGKGYGFAKSSDGITWKKYENNPVFVPDSRYASNEKISVLKIDGVFRGWYTVENHGRWITKHIESRDGIHWENDKAVIDDVMCKDADVVYVNGDYYLYCIGPGNTDISAYTSHDGLQWELREVYEMGTHRHLAAYYEQENSRFALYPSAGGKGVSYAVSEDGIRFEPFVQTWTPPAVGLDDWVEAGITYLSFLRNEHGHIASEAYRPVYYQARNTYDNNIPGWLYHGGERVVLAGKFEGLYTGIPTKLLPDGTYRYKVFPFEAEIAKDFEVFSDRESELLVHSWDKQGNILSNGTITSPRQTLLQFIVKNLEPGENYELLLSEGIVVRKDVQNDGTLIIRIVNPEEGEHNFIIRKYSR